MKFRKSTRFIMLCLNLLNFSREIVSAVADSHEKTVLAKERMKKEKNVAGVYYISLFIIEK